MEIITHQLCQHQTVKLTDATVKGSGKQRDKLISYSFTVRVALLNNRESCCFGWPSLVEDAFDYYEDLPMMTLTY